MTPPTNYTIHTINPRQHYWARNGQRSRLMRTREAAIASAIRDERKRAAATAAQGEPIITHVVEKSRKVGRAVPVRDVALFWHDSKYAEARLHDGSVLLIDESICRLEALLGREFVRINKQALVPVDGILSLDGGRYTGATVRAAGHAEPIPVARRRYPAVVRAMIRDGDPS
ncbi:LytTR family transcriptional regulator DNA-binding domain-containing protein [Pseudomonas sp.]|uniref:LytTR family transcriptional regulator DNA-binding domain-containing protein n=1 Tax=Pseudomonas sp. TaxID=306 RepID=UPI002589E812|nr:LytTR family transcriptional regulator DNA-binding domain-containing protein [Pseudomonas sp.]